MVTKLTWLLIIKNLVMYIGSVSGFSSGNHAQRHLFPKAGPGTKKHQTLINERVGNCPVITSQA